MAKMSKGVIVEFDFTVLNGAEILFDTAKKLLKGAGVELNTRLEAASPNCSRRPAAAEMPPRWRAS